MGDMLEGFRQIGPDRDRPPSPEEILECLNQPGKYPDIEAYLRHHEEYKRLIYDLPKEIAEATDARINVEAFFRFQRRHGIHGLHEQDWVEAEAALCKQLDTSPQQEELSA